MKLTPWFPGTEVPSRRGVYERAMHEMTFYSYWDGKQWWPGDVSPKAALEKYWMYREVGVPRWVSQLWSWGGVMR